MTEKDRKLRNLDRITECWPAFGKKVAAIISDMEGHGFRPRIQDAWRSPADQFAAYNAGHSKLRYGFHNVTGANGRKESLAVDILNDDNPNQESMKFSLMLYSSAHSHGLTTGALFDLPSKLKKAFITAALAGNWDSPVKRGWDAGHVEPTTITPTQAKAGERI